MLVQQRTNPVACSCTMSGNEDATLFLAFQAVTDGIKQLDGIRLPNLCEIRRLMRAGINDGVGLLGNSERRENAYGFVRKNRRPSGRVHEHALRGKRVCIRMRLRCWLVFSR